MTDLESLLAELLLEENQTEAIQERFLNYLIMEPFIRQFRAQGLSNKHILEMCRKLDEKNE